MLLLALHLSQAQFFSPLTVAYQLEGVNSKAAVDQTYKYFNQGTFNWEMITSDYTLIMTTGNDQFHEALRPLEGYFESPVNQEAILSESVASQLLKTNEAAFQPVQLLDRPYLVKSVLKGGNKVYIPFNESLLSKPWNKTTFYYTASGSNAVELEDERLSSLFATTGTKVLYKHYYKDSYYVFYNLALCTALLLLFAWAKFFAAKANLKRRALVQKFEAESPFSRWHDFLKRERSELRQLVRTWSLLLFTIIMGILLMTQLKLPKTWIPGNWFSPKAYWEVGSSIYTGANLQLTYGFFPISRLLFVYLLLLVLAATVLTALLNKFFTKAQSELK